MADVTRIVEILFKGTNKIGSTITSVGRDLDDLNHHVTTVAQPFADLTTAVVKLDAVLAATAAAGIAYFYSESSKLQSATTELKKVIGDNTEALGIAKITAKELSNEYGESAASVLSSTAAYKQAGFDIQGAMTLAKDGMDLVIAGELEASTSSEILIASLKGFKAPAEDARRLIDILNEVSNNYATDIEQLGRGMAGISPIARSMGLSMEETAGLVTPVIEVFRSGDEAAVALKTGLLKLIDDSKPVQEALASIGVVQKDANGNLRSGKDILYDVAKAFQSLEEPQKLFVTQQLVGIEQSARMVEVFDGLSKSSEITATAMDATGSAAKEVAERLKDPEVAVNRLIQGFKNLASSVGDDFQEAGTGAINGITAVLNALENSVDEGAFAPILDALNDYLDGIEDKLLVLSENLPDALEDIDYTGFLEELENIRETIGSLFEDIDFSDPESLSRAIQKVVDSAESLVNFSEGIARVFVTIGDYVSEAIDWFNDLDPATQKLLGGLAGAGAAVTAIAAPIGLAVAALGSLTTALTVAAAAGSAWLGLKIADTINKDLDASKSLLAELEKSAADYRKEIEKLEKSNTTLYNLFADEGVDDKATVLDGLKNKLQLVEDKIKIVRAEAAGEDIFAGMTDDADALKNALAHIAPKFTEIEDSAKELKSALEHNTPRFTVDTNEAKQALQEIEYWVGEGEDKVLHTIMVPVDKKEIEEAKKAVEEIPAEKRLKFETDLQIAEVKAKAQTIQDALKYKAQVDIAEIEAAAKVTTALSENITEMFANTGKQITDLYSQWDKGTSLAEKWSIQESLKSETETRKKTLEMQEKLNNAQIKFLNARTKRMESGQALITVDGAGLQPHLEMIMWELFGAIQIRAKEEGLDQLLLGGS